MLDEGTCKTTIQNMHKLGCKAKLFKFADVLILGHGCGVSQYPQFYDRKNIYQMLPRPYVRSYSGEKGRQFFHEPWILALAKLVEEFFMVSISYMQNINYWKILEIIIDKAK